MVKVARVVGYEANLKYWRLHREFLVTTSSFSELFLVKHTYLVYQRVEGGFGLFV